MKPISDKFIKYDMIRISNESGAKSKIILYTQSKTVRKSTGNLEKGRVHDLKFLYFISEITSFQGPHSSEKSEIGIFISLS